MSDSQYNRFVNVKMPRWNRTVAWVVRIIGLVIFLVFLWEETREETSGSTWPMAGVLIGASLLVLPSLPKAYIEQRNRVRGLRDGSFKQFLKNEQRKGK